MILRPKLAPRFDYFSIFRSRFQPSIASIFSCSSPCRSKISAISSSDIGSANLSEISLNSLRKADTSPRPSSILPLTSLSGSNWGRGPACSERDWEATQGLWASARLIPRPRGPGLSSRRHAPGEGAVRPDCCHVGRGIMLRVPTVRPHTTTWRTLSLIIR